MAFQPKLIWYGAQGWVVSHVLLLGVLQFCGEHVLGARDVPLVKPGYPHQLCCFVNAALGQPLILPPPTTEVPERLKLLWFSESMRVWDEPSLALM